MTTPKFTFRLSPKAEALLKEVLVEVGKSGAKAAAASLQSVVGDVRKRVRDFDKRLTEVERVAKAKAQRDDE